MTATASMFSPNLFWDIDATNLDFEKNARFIVERVLMNGRMSDWDALNKIYGRDKIRDEALKIRYLDKVTLNFCSTYFHIPKSEFRCYNQPQSIQQLWQF